MNDFVNALNVAETLIVSVDANGFSLDCNVDVDHVLVQDGLISIMGLNETNITIPYEENSVENYNGNWQFTLKNGTEVYIEMV